MGQFSWCCGLCDQEVMHGPQPGYQWTTDAVILWPNGDRRSGRYEDGYGQIAGIDLVDQHGGWRLVHQRCFDKARPEGRHEWTPECAELFKSFFKPERHASDQGWWPGERRAIECYGPPNYDELTKDKTYVCYGCCRTWEARWSGGICPYGCVRDEDSDRELVEPFQWLGDGHDIADGLIVCRNERMERPNWNLYHELKRHGESPPIKIEPCFYFGEPHQARVTKPEEWDEFERGDRGEFVIRCSGCKSVEVEVVPLAHGEPC